MGEVLIVAPHALDEVLGCGGVAALAAEKGHAVRTLALFGDGTGHDGRRRSAAGAAAALLGCRAPAFAGFPENRGDTVPLAEMIGAIERAVAEFGPGSVYVPFGGSLHADHRAAYRAAVTALRPAPRSPVAEVLAYEIPSSTDWAPACDGESFAPNRFVDISAALERKMKALELYAFDMKPPPHARSIEALRNLAAYRGATAGLAAAEAFVVVREIWGRDKPTAVG